MEKSPEKPGGEVVRGQWSGVSTFDQSSVARLRFANVKREPSNSKLPLSPTDEVYDFEAVAVVEFGFGPAIAAHNFTVQLDGNAVGLHAEFLDQGGEGGGRQFARFTVDDDFHANGILQDLAVHVSCSALKPV